jgi:DNA-binding NarL/FixJ family response regulator
MAKATLRILVVDDHEVVRQGTRAVIERQPGFPKTEVLIFSAHQTEELIREVFEAGVKSFIFKSEAPRFLVDAIRALSEHKPFFTNKVSEVLFAEILDRSEPSPDGTRPGKRLTPRERQIVQLLAEGQSNKEVAVVLGISTRTAETHRAGVLRKLSLDSLASLVRYAVRNKIIEA